VRAGAWDQLGGVRPAGNRQNDLREGGCVTAWLAVRGTVSLAAGGGIRGRTGVGLREAFSPFREQDERLLICATNSVRALDNAFLRHGRFDYVIPIGPPDLPAREAIWDRYLAAIPHGPLDMAAIVEQSRLFTPADIEFAARRTSQLVFERVLFESGDEEVGTDDILHAIGQTRRTLTAEVVAEFEQDIENYARL